MLKNLEEVLSHSIDTTKARYDNLTHTLQGFLDVVTANRMELSPAEEEPALSKENAPKQAEPAAAAEALEE